ncbi:MAG: hypothetical protein WEA59_05630 [Ferruginibacter sp.]
MQLNSHILNELQKLSATIAGLPRTNVFKVPKDYFEELSGKILLHISKPPSTYNVPEAYFDQLSDQIVSKIIISQQQNKVAEEITALYSAIAGIGNSNIFSVPDNYFSKIEQHAAVVAETASTSATVAAIKKVVTYTVPERYFEQLANIIIAKKDTTRKVVSIKSSAFAWRYTVAAAITAVMAVSVWFSLNKNTEITSAVTDSVYKEAEKILIRNSFDQEMLSISDAAIVAFLEDKGQNVKAALVASLTDVTDASQLPDASDYIMNENALDEILNTLELHD